MDLCTEKKMSVMTPKFGGKLLVCNANVVTPVEGKIISNEGYEQQRFSLFTLQVDIAYIFYPFLDNAKRTYASVVRGYNVGEEDRARTESYSSIDSGFEGLENIEPLDIEDLKRYPKAW